MQGFTQKIVQMMKSESLYESQGGPIILSQACSSYILFLSFFFIDFCWFGFPITKFGKSRPDLVKI